MLALGDADELSRVLQRHHDQPDVVLPRGAPFRVPAAAELLPRSSATALLAAHPHLVGRLLHRRGALLARHDRCARRSRTGAAGTSSILATDIDSQVLRSGHGRACTRRIACKGCPQRLRSHLKELVHAGRGPASGCVRSWRAADHLQAAQPDARLADEGALRRHLLPQRRHLLRQGHAARICSAAWHGCSAPATCCSSATRRACSRSATPTSWSARPSTAGNSVCTHLLNSAARAAGRWRSPALRRTSSATGTRAQCPLDGQDAARRLLRHARRRRPCTTVLGSCISACIRDPQLGIGGMNHFMLPDDGRPAAAAAGMQLTAAPRPATAPYAMESLINELLKLGARRERLEVKLFGGGRSSRHDRRRVCATSSSCAVLPPDRGLQMAARTWATISPRKVYFPATGACCSSICGRSTAPHRHPRMAVPRRPRRNDRRRTTSNCSSRAEQHAPKSRTDRR